MLIGIIETGRPNAALQKEHGAFPAMLARLLQTVAVDKFTFVTYAAVDGVVPHDYALCDGWLVTGSPHAVYERLPWMVQTEALLCAAVEHNTPVVGICFGHQLVAQALGGRVEKSAKGWGLGLQDYAICAPDDLFNTTHITLPSSHQDQVIEVPVGGRVLARSSHCENAVIAYGNRALTFQSHPEFAPELVAAMLQQKREHPEISTAQMKIAEESLNKRSSTKLVAQVIAEFFLQNRAVA